VSPFAKGRLFVCLSFLPLVLSWVFCVFYDLESSCESGLWRLNLLFSEVFNVFLFIDFCFVINMVCYFNSLFRFLFAGKGVVAIGYNQHYIG
jgi:hypothetical protein